MDSAVLYGKGWWDIGTLTESSLGAGRHGIGVEGLGRRRRACEGSFIRVGFGCFLVVITNIICQQMVEGLLKAASAVWTWGGATGPCCGQWVRFK